MQPTFGAFVRHHRTRLKKTLRAFCEEHDHDPGNFSRIERDRLRPPQNREALERLAKALQIKKNTDDWIMFFDLAAAANGQFPAEILEDRGVMEKLPLLFRTLRGDPVSKDQLDSLIELIKRT